MAIHFKVATPPLAIEDFKSLTCHKGGNVKAYTPENIKSFRLERGAEYEIETAKLKFVTTAESILYIVIPIE